MTTQGPRLRNIFSKRNSVVFLLIAIVASLAAISSQYSANTSRQIKELAVQEIRSNAAIQVHHLSNSLANRLADVTNNLQIISKAPAVQENDFERAKAIFNNAELASNEMVDFYMWLDKEGRIVWISNMNQTTYEQYKGFDLSYRSYFMHSKNTLQTYYSSVTDSNDGILRLYISFPILNEKLQGGSGAARDSFDGVVVAGVQTVTLGKFLENEISSKLEGQVWVLDNRGIILYSKDTPYLGKNVFGVRFQSFLSSLDAGSVAAINGGFKAALQGETSSIDTTMGDSAVTFAYQPVALEGEKQFGALYILAPHGKASAAVALIDQQNYFTTLMIIAIAAAASGILFLIFSWNRRLEQTVNARTAELRDANLQLKAHDDMQQEFINVAAHELRTPIQPIIGMVELIDSNQKNGSDEEELTIKRRDLRLIGRNAERLNRLSSDILDATRIEGNALKLQSEQVDLAKLAAEAIDDARKKADGSVRIDFELLHPEETVIVEGDVSRIEQVLSNLINNALRFTKSGKVTVTVARKDGMVELAVRDTGMGIDPGIMPRLFQKFASMTEMGGTGLGLYISKSIIEAHGGRIWAENNKDGSGATFTFTLPADRRARSPPA